MEQRVSVQLNLLSNLPHPIHLFNVTTAGDSYLTQLAQYIGMILVGFIIPLLLKNKQNGYQRLNEGEDHHMVTYDWLKFRECVCA